MPNPGVQVTQAKHNPSSSAITYGAWVGLHFNLLSVGTAATIYTNATSIAPGSMLTAPFTFKPFAVTFVTVTPNIGSTATSINLLVGSASSTATIWNLDTTPLGITPPTVATPGQTLFSAGTRPSILTLAQTANASGVFYLVPGSDSFDGIVQAGQSVAMRVGQSGTATQAGVYNISVWGTPYDMFVTQPEGSNTFGSAVY